MPPSTSHDRQRKPARVARCASCPRLRRVMSIGRQASVEVKSALGGDFRQVAQNPLHALRAELALLESVIDFYLLPLVQKNGHICLFRQSVGLGTFWPHDRKI